MVEELRRAGVSDAEIERELADLARKMEERDG
jgi:hypothetical protein